MFLSPDEIASLTARQRPSAQVRWLSRAGMRYAIGADGSVKVLRAEVERYLLSGPALRVVAKAGVRDARFHDLRGTCLTRAKQAGGLDYVQALAGHANRVTTEGYIARRDVTKVRPIR